MPAILLTIWNRYMLKLILALTAFACLSGVAEAQQQQKVTADQGRAGSAPWPVTWTGQSVLADLRVAGSPVAAGNPVPVTGTIATTQSGTWNVGLNPGTNTIGTVNLGTLNGAATSANQASANGSLSTIVANTTGAATAANQQNEIAAISTRMVNFTDITGTVPAGGTTNGPVHDAGAPAAFSRANASVFSGQGGTLSIQACGDSGCASFITVQSVTFTSTTAIGSVSVPLPTRYWRTSLANASGTTASSTVLYSSMTAN